jgi:hypothetical protein
LKLIGLVGPGNLGRSIVMSLPGDLWGVGPVLSHSRVSGRRAVREMKRGFAVESWADMRDVSTILIAVPQDALAKLLGEAAEGLSNLHNKRLLITTLTGPEASPSIARLRTGGAQIGGLLPIAMYRRPSLVLPNTTFAVWGSTPARKAARELVKAMACNYATVDDQFDKHVLLGVGLAAGMITSGFELAVRRLVDAGFLRSRAIEALAVLAELCLAEHRKARQGPPAPWMPANRSDLLEAVSPADDALCQAAIRFVCQDLRSQ